MILARVGPCCRRVYAGCTPPGELARAALARVGPGPVAGPTQGVLRVVRRGAGVAADGVGRGAVSGLGFSRCWRRIRIRERLPMRWIVVIRRWCGGGICLGCRGRRWIGVDLPPWTPAALSQVDRVEESSARSGLPDHLRAKGFVSDLVLNPDRLDPAVTVDDRMVTLLPGETHRFEIMSALDVDPAALISGRFGAASTRCPSGTCHLTARPGGTPRTGPWRPTTSFPPRTAQSTPQGVRPA